MMTFEQAKNLKIGDELVISYEPNGKKYDGVEYPKLSRVNVTVGTFHAINDYDPRPVKFKMNDDPIIIIIIDDGDPIERSDVWIPIEGITVHPSRDPFEMPEIEPGMHAIDDSGVHWLAIKQSRLSSGLSWFNQKLLAGTYRMEPADSPAFRETITSLFDVDNESGRRVILWDKKKSKQIQELTEKQKQLTAELEAVNAELQTLQANDEL